MKSLVSAVLLFVSVTVNAQTIYVNPTCKTPCKECVKHDDPAKVTYTADHKTQIVLRVIEGAGGKRSDSIPNCKVIDRNNWVCEGYGVDGNSGKQYAANGVAYWIDGQSVPDLERKYQWQYSCRYEKTLIGSFKVLEERKRY